MSGTDAPEGTLQRMLQQLLTPGSSLTATMQMVMNVIFVVVLVVIVSCIYVDLSNVHFYFLGLLLLGLIGATNWFFYLILSDDGAAEGEAKTVEEKKNQ